MLLAAALRRALPLAPLRLMLLRSDKARRGSSSYGAAGVAMVRRGRHPRGGGVMWHRSLHRDVPWRDVTYDGVM